MEILAGIRFEGSWQFVQDKGSVWECEEFSSSGCENRHQNGWEARISVKAAALSPSRSEALQWLRHQNQTKATTNK